MNPMGEISSMPENVHFLSSHPSGTDAKFAAKWTPKNYIMYHSKEGCAALGRRAGRAASAECVSGLLISGLPDEDPADTSLVEN